MRAIITRADDFNPRDNDNLGVMVCFHKRYRLGDSHDYSVNEFNSWDELRSRLEKDYPGGVILGLYLYDHSGITISTEPFSCPWDSGQVGFIVASADMIRENFGVKRVTRSVRERAIRLLLAEVEEYDAYLRGDVYMLTLTKEGEQDDILGPFYGADFATNGLLDSVPEGYVVEYPD